jgi:hypothetical protein
MEPAGPPAPGSRPLAGPVGSRRSAVDRGHWQPYEIIPGLARRLPLAVGKAACRRGAVESGQRASRSVLGGLHPRDGEVTLRIEGCPGLVGAQGSPAAAPGSPRSRLSILNVKWHRQELLTKYMPSYLRATGSAPCPSAAPPRWSGPSALDNSTRGPRLRRRAPSPDSCSAAVARRSDVTFSILRTP